MTQPTQLTPPASTPSGAPDPGRTAAPVTSAALSARFVWTRSRGLLLAVVVLLAAAVALAAVRSGEQHGRLDPRAADPLGSRAVAELLADRGVSTRVVTTVREAAAAAGPDTTLLVAVPDLLTEHQQKSLHAAVNGSGGRTVLVAPGPASIGALAPGVLVEGPAGGGAALSPHCALPAARTAGDAGTDGLRYEVTAPGATSCYPHGGLPTLVRIPAAEGGDTVLLGSPDPLINKRLADHGNASLALQLLGSRPHLVWYLPSLSDAAGADSGQRGFFQLIPSGWLWGALQLAVALGLAALWRGRRFGSLVPERLPVVIRASEAVEGRARLYRRAGARERAATALRVACRTRLAPLLGVSPTQAHTPEVLLPALATRLGDSGQDAPHPLLFGPPPSDDVALVALADRLDALEREVRTS